MHGDLTPTTPMAKILGDSVRSPMVQESRNRTKREHLRDMTFLYHPGEVDFPLDQVPESCFNVFAVVR